MDYFASTSREKRINVCEYCPERPYVELQLPTNVTHVEKIVIRITSHDQGFCDDDGLRGRGGYTWFEVNVSTPTARNNVPRRLIARNIAGQWKTQVHHVLVERESSDDDDSLPRFLDEIKGGDIVQIFPKARWQGWVNHVHAIDLEVRGKTSPLQLRDAVADVKPSYHQLDRAQRSIRLLAIHPGSGSDPVACELVLISLLQEKPTEYEALSYCWGNSGERKTILLHQSDAAAKNVQISIALYGALLHLRQSTTTRYIWADALCINQDDLSECADQVGMMGEIYTRARDVIVWLGEGTDETKAAANTIRNVFAHYQAPTELELSQGLSRGSFPLGISPVGVQFQQVDSNHMGPSILQLSRFFGIPWFWRVWVVQEAWLSKQAIFCCGDDVIEWDSVWKANVWMNINGFNMPEFEQKSLPLIWNSLIKLQELSEHGQPPLRLGLLDLVIQGLDLKATDPRDKIFGLLGLADETHSGQIPASDGLIYPSYTKSASRVFTDFTRWWIQKHKSLKILSVVHATRGRTWQSLQCTSSADTPSYDVPPTEHPSWALWHSGKSKWASELLGFSTSYHASGDTQVLSKPSPLSDKEALQLKLGGIRLGTISSIKPFFWNGNDDEICEVFNRLFDASGARRIWNNPVSSGLQLNEENWDDIDKHFSAHYGDGESDNGGSEHPSYDGAGTSDPAASDDESETLEAAHSGDEQSGTTNITRVSDDEAEMSDDINSGEDDMPIGSDSTQISNDYAEAFEAGSESEMVPDFPCLDDCLFTMSNDSVGLCPAGTRVGDVLVVLFGGSVPYILRDRTEDGEKRWQFVGECYAQGIMDGSALDGSLEKNEEEFVLV
ncbi:HET-domain-containing protein [Pleomassaria siparia CBS 279.74]|uniref:HET-domain-containing protein n=1 Tax=Pleomassaria siparia CBS 279.74 TaxID=1314801 RepID=A0A6G1JZI8_9PLEO|nr:HET-domain-containing protein [Pleomassaria siparia CBS 279.74]